MLIDTKRITEKGLLLEDSMELDSNLLIEEDSYFLDDVDYYINFKLESDNKISAKGKIKTLVSLRCIRCLENFEFNIRSKFDIILFPANLIETSNLSLNPDDMEYIFYEGDKIDFTKILIEQVNLFIPYNPVCNSGCKGICPNCGMNLNDEKCRCDSSNEIDVLFGKIKR